MPVTRASLIQAKPITCDGETRSRQGWARELGGSPKLVTERINRGGWVPCKAATMPVNEKMSAASKAGILRRKLLTRVVRWRGTLVPLARLLRP